MVLTEWWVKFLSPQNTYIHTVLEANRVGAKSNITEVNGVH